MNENVMHVSIAGILVVAFLGAFFLAKQCDGEARKTRNEFMSECVKHSPPLECQASWSAQ